MAGSKKLPSKRETRFPKEPRTFQKIQDGNVETRKYKLPFNFSDLESNKSMYGEYAKYSVLGFESPFFFPADFFGKKLNHSSENIEKIIKKEDKNVKTNLDALNVFRAELEEIDKKQLFVSEKVKQKYVLLFLNNPHLKETLRRFFSVLKELGFNEKELTYVYNKMLNLMSYLDISRREKEEAVSMFDKGKTFYFYDHASINFNYELKQLLTKIKNKLREKKNYEILFAGTLDLFRTFLENVEKLYVARDLKEYKPFKREIEELYRTVKVIQEVLTKIYSGILYE